MFSAATKSARVATAANYIEDVFSTWLYTGTGATQTITNEIDLSTKGGLVWMKRRSTAANHQLYDTARGATKKLASNETTAEATETLGLTAFNSTGFTLGSDSNANGNGSTYASWTFRKQPKFFDVVTYTGDGTSTRNISHSLGSVPGCIIVKRTDDTSNWAVQHTALAANQYLYLNSSAAAGTIASSSTTTSTTFQVGTSLVFPNANGATYVAYLFAHNAGGFGLTGTDNVISCGSFTADGSGNATVNLGYEPQFIIQKLSSGTGNWETYDIMRGWSQTQIAQLYPNLSSAEGGGTATFFFPTATGFQWVGGALTAGGTYIYIAIRRGPMKTPTSGTSVFTPYQAAGNTVAGFPVDLQFANIKAGDFYNTQAVDRLRGGTPLLWTSSSSAELTGGNVGFDSMTGTTYSGWPANYAIRYNFRRAPGFFDEVCYTGNGSTQTITHNLGVVPELIIAKNRGQAGNNWPVLFNFASTTMNYGFLNLTNSCPNDTYANVGVFSAAPTSTSMFLVNSSSMNGSGFGIVAYLFATVAGVSKVGSYTGTGALQTINCGFTSGARFVLIKRTDSTGDWWVYDSARGITSGNDPYLFLNSTAAEVTGTNYVDTDTTGFKVTAAAPAALNANGGTYIYLAIA